MDKTEKKSVNFILKQKKRYFNRFYIDYICL